MRRGGGHFSSTALTLDGDYSDPRRGLGMMAFATVLTLLPIFALIFYATGYSSLQNHIVALGAVKILSDVRQNPEILRAHRIPAVLERSGVLNIEVNTAGEIPEFQAVLIDGARLSLEPYPVQRFVIRYITGQADIEDLTPVRRL